MRTPDELRLSQIAEFFGVTVEYMRRDNRGPSAQKPADMGFADGKQYGSGAYITEYGHPHAPVLREPEAPPYGLPSLRRDDNLVSGNTVAELALISARLLGMVGSTTKGVTEGRFDIGKTIIVLRRLGDILEQKLREAENQPGGNLPPQSY